MHKLLFLFSIFLLIPYAYAEECSDSVVELSLSEQHSNNVVAYRAPTNCVDVSLVVMLLQDLLYRRASNFSDQLSLILVDNSLYKLFILKLDLEANTIMLTNGTSYLPDIIPASISIYPNALERVKDILLHRPFPDINSFNASEKAKLVIKQTSISKSSIKALLIP